jgi:hypothetical protein
VSPHRAERNFKRGLRSVEARANPFRATPFKPARCPSCKTPLDDLYAGVAPNICSLGQCLEHGIWLDHTNRDGFEAAYAEAIRMTANARAAVTEQAREQRELDELTERLAGDDTVSRSELARRLVRLERIVAGLERMLAPP